MDENMSKQTYAELLQAIGGQLDAQNYQDIFLAEVVDGFVGRAAYTAGLPSQGLAYGFEELISLGMLQASKSDDKTHYKTLLGALGHEFDRVGARMIMVLELSIGILVTYYPAGYHLEGCYGERYEVLYNANQLQQLTSMAATM